jgi:hypothetical protein
MLIVVLLSKDPVYRNIHLKMELSADTVKILVSKLNPESLSLIMATSKSVRNVFNDVLSDGYTYKLMPE